MFYIKKLWNNAIVKNKSGQVRSGWIILSVMAFYNIVMYGAGNLTVEVLRNFLTRTGDINLETQYFSSLAEWIINMALPVFFQVLTEVIMIAVPVAAWKIVMKHPIGKLGLNSFQLIKKDGFAGLMLGSINCSAVFFMIITVGGGRVISWTPTVSALTFWWFLVFIMVGIAEELLNRGFLMAVLRRCRNLYVIMFVPSIIFGLIHLQNPSVTFLSVLNIILAGLLFSLMFIKSGNIWMCIGYHIAWNLFQGVIYGMPVSGLNIPGVITTRFTEYNILNGGGFGIEGGVLTTVVTLLSFGFVWYYYRDSKYDFIADAAPDCNQNTL